MALGNTHTGVTRALRAPRLHLNKLLRTAPWAVVGVVVVLVGARIALPFVLQRYVNHVLQRDDVYVGHIGDVDVALVRGAYTIQDVVIEKRNGKVPVPFFASKDVDLSVEWRALFDGSFVGEVAFERPQLNLVAAKSKAKQQTGAGVDWRQTVEDLFPIKINRVTVNDGDLHFRAFYTEPHVDVYLHALDLVAENLTNSLDLSKDRVAHVALRAQPMNAGKLRAKMAFDPFSERPSFDLDAEATGADLTQWNDLLRAYLQLDVQKGTFSFYTELAANQDRFDGYIKPFFKDIDVLDLETEISEQSWFASLWEAIAGVTVEIFEDHSHDRVATRIPISGSVEDPRIGFWRTLGNVARNAFIEAFQPQLERSVGER